MDYQKYLALNFYKTKDVIGEIIKKIYRFKNIKK